jgi:hypothetical protein
LLSLIALIVAAATFYDITVYQPHLNSPPDLLFSQAPPEPSETGTINGPDRSALDVTDYTPILKQEDMAEEHVKFVQSNTSSHNVPFINEKNNSFSYPNDQVVG